MAPGLVSWLSSPLWDSGWLAEQVRVRWVADRLRPELSLFPAHHSSLQKHHCPTAAWVLAPCHGPEDWRRWHSLGD